MFLKKITILLLIHLSFHFTNIYAQLSVDADIRSRFEYRHGYSNLFPDKAEPAFFVAQRSRMNIGYDQEKLKIYLSVQDVSTWGDTQQLAISDNNNSFSLFQAWGQLFMDENWSFKAGRQTINYDDQRIFGEVDWTMQGRFHDAALIKYKKETFVADIGFAFSQEGQPKEGSGYNIQGSFSYKSMQYAYLKKSWNNSSASFLFLNTGFQKFKKSENDELDKPDGAYYRQTVGSYFTFPLKNVNFSGSTYYQFGKADALTDLSAYQISLEGTYKTGKILMGLGFEMLSGTDQNGDKKNKSFFPLYGTNHKFNGFLDYFYVGNHGNNVGLNDFHGKVVLTTGEKSNLLVKALYLTANADLKDNKDKYLGTEVDVVFNQKLMKNVKMSVGYSHMFAAEGMSLIKNGRPDNNTNNWAWVQLVINPNLFKTDFQKEKE